jgi:hypothetical protein
MRWDKSEDKEIFNGEPKFWLWDGSRVVCMDSNSNLHQVNPENGSSSLWLRKSDFSHMSGKSWSPSGLTANERWLVTWTDRYRNGYTGNNGNFNAYHCAVLLDLQNTGHIWYIGQGCEPTTPPSGDWVYHVCGSTSECAWKPDIYRMRVSDRQDRSSYEAEMAHEDSDWGHEYFPRISNDNNWLVYGATTGDHDHDTSDYEIFIHRRGASSSNRERLTNHSGNDQWPHLYVGDLWSSSCQDNDGDGYGVGPSCAGPDCDDGNASVHPGASEACNGADDNCDGNVPNNERDDDSDGYRRCEGDCDDGNASIHPGASEACNGTDDNCDGNVPNNERDDDSDGYRRCEGDCDDGNASVNPGASEACNGVDDNCDGNVPNNERDDDGDGYRRCEGDCDDENASVHPGANEACNGIDDDCDGNTDVGCGCVDGDQQPCGTDEGECVAGTQTCAGGTWGSCEGEVGPVTETCNDLDDDCDGDTDEDCDCVDGDQQPCGTDEGECVAGTQTCAGGAWGNCEGEVVPVTETCNELDDDCDGQTDEGCPVSLPIRINCGSNDFDVSGWVRDDGFVTGGNDYVNPDDVDTAGVANAAPPSVYKTVRHLSPHSYDIRVPDGDYTLRLHFADRYTDRSMDYFVEGVQILDNFDPSSAAGGINKAVVRDFDITISDGDGMQIEALSAGDVFEAGIEVFETTNQPPVVDAGSDSVIEIDEQATLDATVTDDGQPFGTLTFQWTRQSGPGNVTFADANSEDTTATFSEVGDYILQLLASDGALEATDTVSIQVVETGEPAITLDAPKGSEVWYVGTVENIRWSAVNVDAVVIRYSTDNGGSWTEIAARVDTAMAEWGSLPWTVPDEPSKECLVRILDYTGGVSIQSAAPFEIAAVGPDGGTGSDGGTGVTGGDELVIVGSCGGCDSTQTSSEVWLCLLVSLVFLRRRPLE